MGHVFVSYSRTNDKKVTKSYVDVLKGSGINLWLDQVDVNVGENWNEVEANALNNMDAMIVIATPKARHSVSINFEAKYAQKKNVLVIALCLENATLPEFLVDIPKIDVKSQKWRDDLLGLLPQSTIKHTQEPNKQSTTPAKGYIFISYSIEDSEFVEKLRYFLAKKSYAYWDYQETHREYDIPFHLEIEGAIKEASAVISVISPDWKISQWATREFLFSEQVGKTNFVCIVRDVGPTLLYADKTFIEFFNDLDKGFDILDKALRREGLID